LGDSYNFLNIHKKKKFILKYEDYKRVDLKVRNKTVVVIFLGTKSQDIL